MTEPQNAPPRAYHGKPSPPGRLVARLAAAVATAENRWNLYTGVPCLTVVEAVNGGLPFYVVVEIATLDAPVRLKAFADHIEESWAAVGTWSSPTLSDDGVRYDFEPLPLAVPEDRWSFPRAAEVGLLVRAKFPLQASIGFEPQDGVGQYIRLTASERINGRDVDPATFDRPVFKLINGCLNEGSTVLDGADENTGAGLSRLPLTPSTEPTMSTPVPADLKAMLAKHDKYKALVADLVAEKRTEAEIDTAVKEAVASATLTAAQEKVTELTGKLTAATAQVTELQAQLAKATGKPAEKPATMPGAGDDGETPSAPANLAAALAKHQVDHATRRLPMAARLAEVRRLYPDLGKA